jgi:hypothetical protein
MPELPLETSWTEDQEAQRKGHSAERHVRFKGAVSRNLQRETLATDQTPNTSTDDEKSLVSKPTFLERLQYFKWNWFTVVMATGGVADILHSRKYDLLYSYFLLWLDNNCEQFHTAFGG